MGVGCGLGWGWRIGGKGEGGFTVCSAGFSVIGFNIIVAAIIIIIIITIIFIVIITYVIFFAVIIMRLPPLNNERTRAMLTPDSVCEESLVECRTGGKEGETSSFGAGGGVRVEDRVDMRWVWEGEGGCSAGFSLIGFIIIIIIVVVIIIIIIVVIVVIVIVIITIIFIFIAIIIYIIFFAVIIIRFLLLIMSGHGPC